jgi:N-acetylglucosaminyl-diphospho-decaprenol L-rhamnosyltransferase
MVPTCDVAVVAVSYRTGDTVARCLDAVHADMADAPVYLVDNASLPDRLEDVMEGRAWVTTIPLVGNLGFAGGANVGIESAFDGGATHVLLLNDDVFIEPGCVSALIAAAGGSGAASPWLRGEGDAAFRGGRIDWERGYAGHVTGASDYLIGGCLLLSRDAWRRTGAFDESFFLYCEDVDWCIRARDAGVPLVVVEKELAEHVGGSSTGGGAGTTWAYWWSRNRIKLLRKHRRGHPARVAARQVARTVIDAVRSADGRHVATARLRGTAAGLRA